MKLCVPVSDVFREKEGDLLPLVDVLELKIHKNFYPHSKELVFHLNGFIDLNFVENLEKNNLLDYLVSMRIHYLSFDLGPSCLHYSIGKNGEFKARGDVLIKKEIMSVAGERLSFIKESFSGVLAIENLDYHDTGAYERVCEPQFICDFVEHFNLQFLLDIGHAKVSADQMGYSIDTYLKLLPLNRVIEIHLSHAGFQNGSVQDLHGIPTDEDYQLVGFVLEQACPEYLTLEYYESSDLLLQEYRFLRQKVDRFNKTNKWR